MYEHHTQRLLSRRAFLGRMVRHGELAAAVLGVSLVVGITGFHWLALQGWLDAFLNSAMLLGGMGLVGTIEQTNGKLFAAFYALYAGVAFLTAWAVVAAPVAHRILHKLHLDERAARK